MTKTFIKGVLSKFQYGLVVLFLLLSTAQLSFAQENKIKGRVLDSKQQPVIGATVIEKGTANGAIVDHEGNFILNLSTKDAILIIEHLGYETIEEAVNGRPEINFTLVESTLEMDDVVVIGYGTVKKSDLTGAVSSVKGKDIAKMPVSTVGEALQGQVAGVTVSTSSGQPGQGATIRIRGIGSVNSGVDPLYVVDGMIVDDINFLGPNDIASIEVLKDASSAAIYGSRAANGVILVTTKNGTKGQKTNISFDAYYGVQNRWRKLDLLDSDQYINALLTFNGTDSQRELYETGGLNAWLDQQRIGGSAYFPVATSEPGKGFDYSSSNTDWQDAVFVSNAPIQNYHLSVDGANEKTTYIMSANYFSQDGTIIGSSYERLNVRLNTSYKPTSWLKIGENLNFSTSSDRWAMNNSASAGASVISAALAMAPWDPTHYPEGSINYFGDDLSGQISAASNFKEVTNPFSMEKYTHVNNADHRLVGMIYADITPIKGLVFRSDLNFDLLYARDRTFEDAYIHSSYDKREKNSIGQSMAFNTKLIFNNIATYNTEFGNHALSLMGGHTAEISYYESVSGGGKDILNPDENNWNVNSATTDRTVGGSYTGEFRRMSLLGRVQYNYNQRYLFTFSWRSDANRVFKDNLWGHFPSVAFAWKVMDETFMASNTLFSDLKVRLSWGRLGNDDVGSDIFTQTMVSSNSVFSGHPFGPTSGDSQTMNPGASINTRANLSGRWEITEHYNLAFDYGFLDNKLTGALDLFIRDTKDILLSVQGPLYTGTLYPALANVGTMRNAGVELSVAHQNSVKLAGRSLTYTISGNVSYIKNNITTMNGADRVDSGYTITDAGYAVNSFFGYEYLGVYKSQEEIDAHLFDTNYTHSFKVGDAKYADLNNDGRLDDTNDKKVLGNAFPNFTYGLNISAAWGGFDLQMFLQGVQGNKIYNAMRVRTESNGTTSQLSTAMLDAWSEFNTDGTIPNPNNTQNFLISDRFLEDGSYLRLKNLQFGYTLPMVTTAKYGINRLRVYCSVNNLFTITDYTGYDPEVGSGIDYGNYPQSRTVMLGVNVNF